MTRATEVDLGFVQRLSGEQTGGALAIVEHPMAPGVIGAPIHTHSREDECSYVLEGRVVVRVGDREIEAGPGELVWKPRGVPHAFWNPGPERARVLEVVVPAGVERFFAELQALLAAGAPDLGQLAELGARFGITYDFGSIPDLLARGLRVPAS